ncbi:hypothetical protein [Cryobacterium aureum]|uniref:hypothetical protein n=1 Tax=Cryobacterium aureum TaxID=995037 RepID=UPI000CF3E270|nr:hypothetical protein [Cryobacterium aureum]
MTDTLHPVNAVDGAPAYSGRMLRQAAAVALAGATAARPLGARSGVRPGTSTTTVTATSTTWTCGPFAGTADVQAAAEAGPYDFAFDAAASGSMAAANASYARTDILYVQVDDPSESDGSTVPAVTRKYLAGQAVAGQPTPVPPVAHTFVVARINVPKSGAGSPVVTWVAPYAVAAGGILPCPTASDYPAAPYPGQLIDDWTVGLLRWNGTAWSRAGLGRSPLRDSLQLVNTAYVSGGVVLGDPVIIQAQPYAQRVVVDVSGLISPSSAGTAGIGVTASAGVLSFNPQARIYTNIGGQYYGFARKGYVTLPASTGCTITFTSEGTVSAAYQVTAETHALAAGEY